jgi:hypothetical protein
MARWSRPGQRRTNEVGAVVIPPLVDGNPAILAAEAVYADDRLGAATLNRLLGWELAWRVRRWTHREEHIEQIAAAFAS